MLYIKYNALGLVVLDKKIFEFHFENLFIDSVTYLCNQPERFEQI